MTYDVDWSQDAALQLADIWTRIPDRNRVTAASFAIDQLLARVPASEGESRPDGRRILFAPPLGILFRVDEQTKTVLVSECWMFRTRQ